MDRNELYMLETKEESNKYYLFLKKITFHFLLPVSLLSFFLTYTSGFSFFYSSTIVFPIFAHAFERKYMFLVCNGILAFLAKNLCLSCSSPTVSDPNGQLMEGSETDGYLTETKEAVLEESEAHIERNTGPSQHTELKTKVEHREQEEEEKETMYLDTPEDERESGILISEDADGEFEGCGPVGASPAEEGKTLDLNTEELNRKIEDFIRKMKEEIRIEARHQPIAV